MKINYCKNGEIKSSDIIEVFNSVGWNKDKKVIEEAFRNSYYILAFAGGRLVGFARALSDKNYYTGIYDVVVRPEFQHQGIAKNMIKQLVKEFEGTYFFLTYTDGNREFYKRCGFIDNNQAMWIPK